MIDTALFTGPRFKKKKFNDISFDWSEKAWIDFAVFLIQLAFFLKNTFKLMFNGVIYCGNVQIQYGTLWVRVRL